MSRVPAFLAVVLLAVPAVVLVTPASAAGALFVDAGDSKVSFDGAAIAMAPRVIGGTPPYSYAWDVGGSAAPFSAPTAEKPSLSVAGATPGSDILVALNVTDALGVTARDTVLMHVDAPASAIHVVQAVEVGGAVQGFGLPSPAPESRFEYTFTVAETDARIAVALDWTDDLNDLDVILLDPDGDTPTTAAAGANKPEKAALFHPVFHPKPGTWTVRVTAFQLVGPDTFTLDVAVSPQSGVPFVHPLDAYRFGALDAQKIPLRVQWSASWTGAWDLDNDGVHETISPSPTASFAPGGPYPVAVKVTTADGYEGYRARTVTVLDTADHVLRWGCGGAHDRPFWAMEYSVSDGTCWYHGGHHTYDLGAGYTLVGLNGRAFSVEQELAPPTELQGTGGGIQVETSLDGVEWKRVGFGTFDLVNAALGTNRQQVTLTAGPDNGTFQMFRVREPLSSTQGLSGYLDSSEGEILVDEAVLSDPGPKSPGSRTFACDGGALIEDFFAEHPCWFGGVDRWDSASFTHTYALGAVEVLDRVNGSFVVAPFRTDDFFDLPPTEQTTETRVFVQTSVDGMEWHDVAAVRAPFGTTVYYDLLVGSPGAARYVRLVPDEHPGWARTTADAPLHHLEGYFLESTLTVTGNLSS